MRRRDFITLVGGAAVARPLAARAQQTEPVRRIGVFQLLPENDPESVARHAEFQRALQSTIGTAGLMPIVLVTTRWRWSRSAGCHRDVGQS